MDPITLASAFATLVSLVGQYLSVSEEAKQNDFNEFIEWLTKNNHDEIKKLLEINANATIGVKALLNQEKEKTDRLLIELGEGFLELGKKLDGIGEIASALESSNLNTGKGGEGGSGTIIGNRGTVIGGRGGNGGIAGIGGKGGSGHIHGDDGLIIGGDGGNCPTADGRGGQGARGPTERFGISTEMWGYGRGGTAPNHPEYDRRVSLLQSIREEYLNKFPADAPYIHAGIDPVPVDWVNQRLAELGEKWSVKLGAAGYELPALSMPE